LYVAALIFLVNPFLSVAAMALDAAATYRATWAGLPAGEIRLSFHDSGNDYRDEIEIASGGLPRLLTKFRAYAFAEGRLPIAGAVAPSQYDALYDLRKRRDSRLKLRFVARGDGWLAERGAGDTSRKPPLAESFRRNAIDPLSALAVIRHELQVHRAIDRQFFVVPVFDGARRFDVAVRVVASNAKDHLIRLRLTLRPIAGFKGESSEDGDPDSAPRPVDVAFSDDEALLPVSLRVSIAYLPLDVRLDHVCASFATCSDGAH
jgi:hypothetical protein